MRQDDCRPSSTFRIRVDRTSIPIVLITALVTAIAVQTVVQPVAASGSAGATDGGSTLHTSLELLQLFAGATGVVTAILGVQTMRGGRMERAFYLLTAGVVTFLLQRLWHSVHEIGILPMPGLAEQVLFLGATVLMAAGFVQTHRIMQPSR